MFLKSLVVYEVYAKTATSQKGTLSSARWCRCAKCKRGKHGCARKELQWGRFDLSFSLKGTGNQITEKREGQTNHGLYSKWAKEQLHENVIARLSLENNCHHHLQLWSFPSVCVKRCRDKMQLVLLDETQRWGEEVHTLNFAMNLWNHLWSVQSNWLTEAGLTTI